MTARFYVQAATPDKEVLQALFDNLDLLQRPFLCAWGNCCFCGNTRHGNKKIHIFIV